MMDVTKKLEDVLEEDELDDSKISYSGLKKIVIKRVEQAKREVNRDEAKEAKEAKETVSTLSGA